MKGWKIIKEVLYYLSVSYIPKVMCSELISKYYNDLLIGHFDIEKTQKLIARKYYWLMLQRDVEAYVENCDICLDIKNGQT